MAINAFFDTSILSLLSFLAVLAFYKKSNTPKGYRFLSILFILLGFVFADELLESTFLYKEYPALIIVFQPVLYAFPPIIYFAVIYLTTAEKRLSPKLGFHFIPYLLVLSLYLFASQQQSDIDSSLPKDDTNIEKLLQFILLSVFFVQIGIYLYLSIKHLKRYRQILPLYVSNIPANDFHWLFKTIVGLSLIAGISFAEVVFDQMDISFYFSILYLIGFYYIGIQLSGQNEVFPFSHEQQAGIFDLINDQMLLGNDNIRIVQKEIEYNDKLYKSNIEDFKIELPERKKVISEEKLSDYRIQLLELMEREKPYLDSEITLPKLGRMIHLTTYQTSFLINNCFGENFFTFINHYRLDECKKMLLDKGHTHLNILEIAYNAGFNSKTAFNTSFKKSTGLSPKEFIKQNTQSNL